MNSKNKGLKKCNILLVLAILCLCVMSAILFAIPKNNANAITNIANAKNVGNLLADNYENKKKIFDSDTVQQLFTILTGQEGATIDDVQNLGKLNSDNFRNLALNTNKQDLIVTLGGYTWNLVYLSNTKENGTGDVILTLWLTHSGQLPQNYRNSTWNTYYTGGGAYPSNMYGTSYIRAVTLNNGGKYATSNDTLSNEVSKSKDNPFAIFTMSNSDTFKGSLTDFIETPANVEWQENITARDNNFEAGGSKFGNNFNNDAYSMTSPGYIGDGGLDYTNVPDGVTDRAEMYPKWKDDKIWLPSMAETGFYQDSMGYDRRGLWRTTPTQRGSDADLWVRSAHQNYYSQALALFSSGNGNGAYATNNEFAVQPAFHLNLTKVADSLSATIPNSGGNSNTTKFTNNGNDVTFSLNSVQSNKVDIVITATDRNGANLTYSKTPSVSNGVLSFTANVAGTYTVKVTPKEDEIWSDGTNEAKTYTYKLKEPITPLTWKTSGEGKATKTYNGKTQYFVLENYDENEMNVSPAPVKIPNGETDAGKWAIAVKDVTDTSITVTLKDTGFAGWSDGNAYDNTSAGQKTLAYKMNTKALTATAGEAWSTQVSTSDTTYDVYIDVFDGDIASIEFEGYYKKESGTEKKAVAPTVVKDGDNRAKVTVTLPELTEKGSYEYSIKLKSGTATNKNYTLSFNKAFTVDNKKLEIGSDDIIWRYTNSKVGAGYQTVGELDANGIFNVEYNGAAFTFDVDTDAMSKDAEYKVEGEKSATVVKLNGTAVEYYTATLKITPKEGVDFENKEFTLKWRINKAKFDLTNVKWNYNADNPKHFNDKEQEVVMTGIPDGLTFNYINNKKRLMGSYKAEVTSITVRNDLKNNYITPDVKKADTYKGDVAWSLDWRIKKGELELDWIPKQENDVNDKAYSSWESSNYADKIEYKYYTVEAYADGELTGDSIDKA
ncbi:MAG: hypothetical protein K2N18_02305, partial [Clostridia bacterium]|nr:hypothetical protein [Clostridia bacterium]